jgi:DNA-binding NtrC family response regulator
MGTSFVSGKDKKSSRTPSLQGVRVLVVEDGWQVANALKISLESMGMVVAGPAATAADARRLAVEHSPGLAVVDVNLKGEMAYGLMDWLHDRGTRVIVISGYEDLPGSLGRFAAILHKPFTETALQTTLRQALAPDRAP